MGRMLRGDFGQSRVLRRPVRELLAERGLVTLRLVAAALIVAWGATICVTLLVWLCGSGAMDAAFSVGSGLLLCLPAGALALLLVVFDGPAFVALALVVLPRIYQYLSTLLSATAQMPHVITARAEGASPLRVFLLHVVPVVRREVLALAGVTVGMAVGAAIPVESLCGTPGLGQLAWQSALARDVPVLTNLSMLVIACTVLANTGADMLSDERRGEV
jgi:peptide/nickel transport system permease protein